MEFIDIVNQVYLEQLIFHTWEHVLVKEAADDSYGMIEPFSNPLGGGIYRMYDAEGDVVYVGKSNDIHRRLLQHVGRRSNTSYFIEEVVKIEYHKNDDPVFQTMLEGIFIAYHEPIYNDEMQDRIRNEK
ncbi:MAG TPA: GIY-YIG nuclease family protein [Candidatus Saccharimonadales bacterium]|nr:GIY-YIG nuclease family protein [Candidatus Saccharimonadales bacterium]